MKMRDTSIVIAGLVSLQASAAFAQSETLLVQPSLPDDFDRGRNISVQQRARPDYDPTGIRAGGFNIYPTLETSAAYTDNVCYSKNNPISDGSIALAPRVEVMSDWSRHQFRLRAGARFQRYFDETRRNQDPWNLGALGRIEVSNDLRITPELQIAREFETPFSGETTATRTALSSYLRAFGSLRLEYGINQTKLTLAIDDTDYNFNTIRFDSGAVVTQQDRDRNIFRVTGQGQYAFTPSLAAYLQLGYRKTNYSSDLLASGLANRDSDGYRVIAGFNFDFQGLMRGTIGVGYTTRNYKSPIYNGANGISAEAKVEYFPSELTTFTLGARRAIEDSSLGSGNAFFDNRASLRVDHELLRNLILSATGEYSKQDYIGSPQNIDVYRIAGSATLLSSNTLSFNVGASYTGRSANEASLGQGFNEFRGQIGVVFKR